MKLSITQRAEFAWVDTGLFLKESHRSRGPRRGKFPVAGELAMNRHVVRVADDVDLAVGVLREHTRDLLQDSLSLRL